MRTARGFLLVVAFAAPVVLFGLGNHTYWLSDEPFVAEIGREMAVSGDWVVPRLNGRPFLEKPPLHAAAVALSFRALGVTPLASRIPSAVATLLTTLALYLLGRRLLDESTAFWAALGYPTISQVFYVAHYCLVDAFLALFVTTGFLAGSYAFGPDRRRWALPALYASGALAFLSKGVVGPGLLGAGVLTFVLVRPTRRIGSLRGHALGAALAVLLVGPWIAALWATGGRPYLREALLVNTVGRYVSSAGLVPADDRPGQHVEPASFYLGDLPANFLPWSPLMLSAGAAALAGALRRRRKASRGSGDSTPPRPVGESFLWSAFLPGFFILSGASEKRGVYLLPLFPVLALLTAAHLRALAARSVRGTWERLALGVQSALSIVFALAAAAFLLYASGPALGRPPGATAVAAAAALSGSAVVAAFLAARSLLDGRIDDLARSLWAITTAALLAIAVCAPLFEPMKSLNPFFAAAARMERDRGRTPALLTSHESLIGYAGLTFGRVLPAVRRAARSDRPWPGSDEADVITDIGGLRTLTDDPDVRVVVLLSGSAAFADTTGVPYLVACSWSPPRPPAAAR